MLAVAASMLSRQLRRVIASMLRSLGGVVVDAAPFRQI
jgi:hypothetical protein